MTTVDLTKLTDDELAELERLLPAPPTIRLAQLAAIKAAISRALRDVWNARGAADLEAFLSERHDDGTGANGVIMNDAWFAHTIKAQDR